MAIEMLRRVGMPKPERVVDSYPYQLSRRHAPARDDRHGALVPAQPADRRRADHGARRDHRGPDPRADARPAGGDGHGDHVHHPQPGRDRRDGRRGVVMYLGKVVERAPCRRDLLRPEASVHRGAAALDPAGWAARSEDALQPIRAWCPTHTTCRRAVPSTPAAPSSCPGMCDDVEPPVVDLGSEPLGALPAVRSGRCRRAAE